MTFNQPVTAYQAASNLEAHFVCNLLNDADIDAIVIEGVSAADLGIGAMVPGITNSQVWIERTDTDRARPVLDEYERRRRVRLTTESTEELVEAACEECGKRSSFPAALTGTVQFCPHCNAYVDVGDEANSDEWQEVPDDEPADA